MLCIECSGTQEGAKNMYTLKEEKLRQLKGFGEYEIWKDYNEKCYYVIFDDNIVDVFKELKDAQKWARIWSK